MFGKKNDLANVEGVVCHLAVDGLHHGVRLTPNINRALKVRVLQRLKGGKQTTPSRFL